MPSGSASSANMPTLQKPADEPACGKAESVKMDRCSENAYWVQVSFTWTVESGPGAVYHEQWTESLDLTPGQAHPLDFSPKFPGGPVQQLDGEPLGPTDWYRAQGSPVYLIADDHISRLTLEPRRMGQSSLPSLANCLLKWEIPLSHHHFCTIVRAFLFLIFILFF